MRINLVRRKKENSKKAIVNHVNRVTLAKDAQIVETESVEDVSKQAGWFRRLNNWVSKNNQSLSGWSSITTILSFPLVFLSLFLGYSQIKDILSVPNVELEFMYPQAVAYKVVNLSDKIAENVLVSFGIFDLDGDSKNPVQLPSIDYDWVNEQSAKGPFAFLSNFGKQNHRYFGIIYVSCRGCRGLETYWLYVKHGVPSESFYSKRNNKDTFQINITELTTNTEKYLQQLVPLVRREYIRN